MNPVGPNNPAGKDRSARRDRGCATDLAGPADGNVLRPAAFQTPETRTRLLLAGLPLFAGLLSPSGDVLECNFGPLGDIVRGQSDWIGKRFEDGPWWAFSESSRADIRLMLGRAQDGRTVSRERLYLRARDPETLGVMSLTLTPLKKPGGGVDSILVSALDVTERGGSARRSEGALRADLLYRMRNSFAVMDALAAGTDPQDGLRLERRLDCVRRAHRLCAHYLFFDVPVGDVVEAALGDHAAALDLAPISVPARQVETLLSALSELAQAGHAATLSVARRGPQTLRVIWQEAAPRAKADLPRGLSAAILDDIVCLQSGGAVTQGNRAKGYCWVFDLPVPDGVTLAA